MFFIATFTYAAKRYTKDIHKQIKMALTKSITQVCKIATFVTHSTRSNKFVFLSVLN